MVEAYLPKILVSVEDLIFDQVCVFDYALSESQVSTLYGNNSAGYFQIGNPMALTPNPVVFYPLGDQDVQQTVDSTDWRIPNQVATGGDVFQSVPLRTTNTVPTDTITSNINYTGTQVCLTHSLFLFG